MKVVSVDQMRDIEAASDAAGHSYAAMMELAGRAVADAAMARLARAGEQVLVLVGPGHNGGDGLVAARIVAAAGAEVVCYLVQPRDPETDDVYGQVAARDIPIVHASEDAGWGTLRQLAATADVIVDAVLGTGTRLPLRGRPAEMLAEMGDAVRRRREGAHHGLVNLTVPDARRREGPLVVAVDGPTGLEYDSGALSELAIPADVTVTFAYPKSGHFKFPGAGALGELIVANIGTDPGLAEGVEQEVADPQMVRGMLPSRPPDAHKGTFGKALIVAGSANYTGAAYLAGAAATRVGAGLVTLGLPAAIHAAVAARLSEATYLLLPHDLGAIGPGAVGVIAKRLSQYGGLLLGPGLGRERGTGTFVRALLGAAEQGGIGFLGASSAPSAPDDLPPLVIDADGLNILAEIDDWPARLPPQTILTPHPGEMARLSGYPVTEVQAHRVDIARDSAAAWGHVVVLKGAHTVVAMPDGRTVILPFANPGLATAGTGDVLAGAIVGLRVQGLGPFEAAVAGSYVHGLAGELARREMGAAGMVAGDVLLALPRAMRHLAAG